MSDRKRPRIEKSARVYCAIVNQLPSSSTPNAMRTQPYQEAAKYLRALYGEHGRANVRRAIEAGRNA